MDEGFRPIAGAEVELTQQPQPSLPVRSTTDEHGDCRYSGLQPGEYSVLASADGFINHQVTNIR
jgi:protocatechuate 3,4-dioxygenase beta subunit